MFFVVFVVVGFFLIKIDSDCVLLETVFEFTSFSTSIFLSSMVMALF